MEQASTAVDTLKVLILASDPAQAAALAEVVKTCGYVAESAEDYRSATFWLEIQEFDVMLYQDLPPNGFSAADLQHVRAKHPNLPLIVVTRNAASPATTQAAQAGAKVLVMPPGDYSSLFPELAALQSKPRPRLPMNPRRTTVHSVALTELHSGNQATSRAGVDMVLDVPITINAILGHRTMLISDLLELGPGSVVELNKRAGDPIDLYVNDKLVATGEVVVVNDT